MSGKYCFMSAENGLLHSFWKNVRLAVSGTESAPPLNYPAMDWDAEPQSGFCPTEQRLESAFGKLDKLIFWCQTKLMGGMIRLNPDCSRKAMEMKKLSFPLPAPEGKRSISCLMMEHFCKISGRSITAEFSGFLDRDIAFRQKPNAFLQSDIVQIFSRRSSVCVLKLAVQGNSMNMKQIGNRGGIHFGIGIVLKNEIVRLFRHWARIKLRSLGLRKNLEGGIQSPQLRLMGTIPKFQHDFRKQFFRTFPGGIQTKCEAQGTEKTWNQERFPLMLESFKFRKRTFIDALKYGMGFHFELWLCDDYDLTYEEERRRDRNYQTRKDEIIRDTEEFDQHLGYANRQDKITKPEIPWFEHLKSFVDWGADFFKTDAANQVNNHPDRLCGNGMTDAECHNFYPLMLMRQMWEGFSAHTNRRPFIFNPCGWTTFQKWASTWTGDTGGGAATLCGMFNTCFVGHGLTTNDMAANKVEGVHFGYLLPLSQINNYSSWKMPWVWGPKFIALHRYYSSLRSRLIPYFYSCMRKTTQDGIPFLFPPAMEFPQDPHCRSLKNEYLLGPSLLITAYTSEAYFPEGGWKDYWTGKFFAGGQTHPVVWPEDRGGGLFVREGAIIPFSPVMQYRGERDVDEVDLYLYPGRNPTTFEYYEDDGVSFDYLKGKYALSSIRLERTTQEAIVTLNADSRSRVKKWSATVACTKTPREIVFNREKLDFIWDEARQEVKIPHLPCGIVKIIF